MAASFKKLEEEILKNNNATNTPYKKEETSGVNTDHLIGFLTSLGSLGAISSFVHREE